jgi:DNA-directed RNA polymerase subunit E'/Rpb7
MYAFTTRMPNEHFVARQTESLSALIKAKFMNKVVRNVGHVLLLYDILEVGDGFIFPGNGGLFAYIFP